MTNKVKNFREIFNNFIKIDPELTEQYISMIYPFFVIFELLESIKNQKSKLTDELGKAINYDTNSKNYRVGRYEFVFSCYFKSNNDTINPDWKKQNPEKYQELIDMGIIKTNDKKSFVFRNLKLRRI